LEIAETKMSKTRRIHKAIREVHTIREALQTLNETEDGRPQWHASYDTPSALLEDDEFQFGLLHEVGRRAMIRPPPINRIIPLKPGETTVPFGRIKIPREYDARQVWGARCPSFHHVIDQGPCGNCWSIHATNLINHRTCQYNKEGEPQFYHSVKHLTTCQPKGCDGGWVANGFDYWISQGIVSGGEAGEALGCKPYPVNYDEIKSQIKNQTCSATCDDGTSVSVAQKSYGGAKYQIAGGTPSTELEMMTEIFLYGPIISTFDVYDDFAHYYKSGVYKRVSPKFLGGHATTILGWGVENGVKYWHAANSWGTVWGDGGFFKIQRGTNECNIEKNIFAAVPREGLRAVQQYPQQQHQQQPQQHEQFRLPQHAPQNIFDIFG